jgi:hypothetical protein
MTWNWVFLSETGEKIRLYFGKMTWNWVFLSETCWKLRICFGKMTWNWEFLSETSEKLRFCLKSIILELCLFVDMKWLQFEKSQFMTIHIWKTKIFIGLVSKFEWYLSKNSCFHILSYCIDIKLYLIGFLYWFWELAHPWC